MDDLTVQINKSLISIRFKRSLQSYDIHASIQKTMAQQLVSALVKVAPEGFNRLLELGCGTGLLTRTISKQLKVNQYYANDLVGEVSSTIRPIITSADILTHMFIEGDAETMKYPVCLDVICAGAVVQWFQSLSGFYVRSSNALCDRGWLAFSSFGPSNFKEIRELTGSGLEYYTSIEAQNLAMPLFVPVYTSEWEEQLWFTHPIEVLHHIKLTGVGGVSDIKWSKVKLNNFIDEYKRFETNEGFPLTYHPQLFVFRKR